MPSDSLFPNFIIYPVNGYFMFTLWKVNTSSVKFDIYTSFGKSVLHKRRIVTLVFKDNLGFSISGLSDNMILKYI